MSTIIGNLLKDEYSVLRVVKQNTKLKLMRLPVGQYLDYEILFNMEPIKLDSMNLYMRITKNHNKELTHNFTYKAEKEIIVDNIVEKKDITSEADIKVIEEELITKYKLDDIVHLSLNFIPELSVFNIVPIYLNEETKELSPKKEDYLKYLKIVLTVLQNISTERFKGFFKNKLYANNPTKHTLEKELAKKNFPIFIEKNDSFKKFREESLQNLQKTIADLEVRKFQLKKEFLEEQYIQDDILTDIISKTVAGDVNTVLTRTNVSLAGAEISVNEQWNWVFLPISFYIILKTLDPNITIFNILKGE